MAKYRPVLDHLLRLIPRSEFQSIVHRHQGDKGVRTFSCWNQFVCLFYGQLTGQHSLRDLITALNSSLHKLRHVGLSFISRSTLAEANRKRPEGMYRELFHRLYSRCMACAPRHGFRFPHKIYLLDASVITLSLKVFDWARYQKTKGAVKLHMMLDLDGLIPSFCVVTEGREPEVKVARRRKYEPDSILIFDRGYNDYHWYHQLALGFSFFVTRLKKGASYKVTERRRVDKSKGLTCDQTIRITGRKADCLPIPLRRVGYRDPDTGRQYFYLTNLFHLTALEIADLYKARWQVEIFFKWIKQHLKIKSFLGTNSNAVMTQIWVALCVFLLASYVRFLNKVKYTTYEVFKRLQVTALEYLTLEKVLENAPRVRGKPLHKPRQLPLWNPRLNSAFSTG